MAQRGQSRSNIAAPSIVTHQQSSVNMGGGAKGSTTFHQSSTIGLKGGAKNLRELKKQEMLNNLTKKPEDLEKVRETWTKFHYDKYMSEKKKLWENVKKKKEQQTYKALDTEAFNGQNDKLNENLSKEDLEYELSLRPRKLILQESSRIKFIWDSFIILFAFMNAMIQPYIIAFNPDTDFVRRIQIFFLIIDICFFFDIIVSFRTTYMNNVTGDEIWSPQQIAKNYGFSFQFVLDLIAFLPFDFLLYYGSISSNQYVRELLSLNCCIKITKIFIINKIISNLNTTLQTKGYLKTLNLVFSLLLYLHFYTCMYWYVFKIAEDWISPLEWIYRYSKVYESNNTYKYFFCLYYATMAFGRNEVAPRSNLELFFISATMIFGVLISAFIFGTISGLLQENNKKQIRFNNNIDTANATLATLNVPKHLSLDVRHYIQSTFALQDSQEEMITFLEEIPPSFKKKVTDYVFSIMLPSNPQAKQFLLTLGEQNEKEQFLQDLLQFMNIKFVPPEEVILAQFDSLEVNANMYFIEKGTCKVTVKDKHKLRNQDKDVRTLQRGDHFGEVALIFNGHRSCTVASSNFTTLGLVDQQSMHEIFAKYPDYKCILLERVKEYDDVLKIFFEKVMNTIEYMQGVSAEVMNELIYSLVPEYHEKDSVIFKVEDLAEKLYVIQNGMVEMFTLMDNTVTFILERLYRGSVINYKSFLLQDPLDISARAATPASLYYLSLERFSMIRQKSNELNESVSCIEDQLVDRENAVTLDYVISKKKQEALRPDEVEQYRNSLTVTLKNAVMYHIVKAREQRRVPKFKDIMEMLITKKKKEMQAARKKKNNLILGDLSAVDDKCSEDQFSILKEGIEKIEKAIEEHTRLIDVISKKTQYVIRKKDDDNVSARRSRSVLSLSKQKSSQYQNSGRKSKGSIYHKEDTLKVQSLKKK